MANALSLQEVKALAQKTTQEGAAASYTLATLTTDANGNYVLTFPSRIRFDAVKRTSTGKGFTTHVRYNASREEQNPVMVTDADGNTVLTMDFGSIGININLRA